MCTTNNQVPKAFITGISGFVGRHLTAHLVERQWSFSGSDLKPAPGILAFYRADIEDRLLLAQALAETQPDVVFHLAGMLKPRTTEQLYRIHVLGTISLLDAIVECNLRPVVIIASSSAVYGAGSGREPITENFKPRPITHYAVSKLAQEIVALRYQQALGVSVICVRMFNLIGPGLSPEMACSAFAKQIAEAENKGLPAVISTGDLNSHRDFVDVRDAVCAQTLLAEHGKAGKCYNVASEQATSIRECLDFLRKQAKVPIEAVVDPAIVQKNDVPVQVGSAKRLRETTGWKAEISLEQSLTDMLEDWRKKVNVE